MFTTAILVFIFCWNDFVFAISLTSTNRAQHRAGGDHVLHRARPSSPRRPATIAAAAVVVTIPIIIMVLIFQRRIVAGLTVRRGQGLALTGKELQWPRSCSTTSPSAIPTALEAVNDVDLDIADGEFLILVGPSGCGKSTRAADDRRPGGHLRRASCRSAARWSTTSAPKDRDIAMVFQSYALYPHMTVRENMGFALKLAKTPEAEINEKVDEAARILDLEQLLDRKPANLSGGQRQRVAMGRAIVRDPSAFLMDEPLSNLDAKLRVQTRTEIAADPAAPGTTTIYVTHDQTEALTLGDRIAVMRAGMLQQVGPPSELYDAPDNLFVAGFIGSPVDELPRRRARRRHAPPADRRRADPRRAPAAAGVGPGGGRGGVIAGLRPEHFEDAALVPDRSAGVTFNAKIDVLESMGSEFYAYFVVESERVSSTELEELAQDAGGGELQRGGGVQLTVRLGAESKVQEGQDAELWFDPRHLQLFDSEAGHSLLASTVTADPRPSPPPRRRLRRLGRSEAETAAAGDHGEQPGQFKPQLTSLTYAGAALHRLGRRRRAGRLPARSPARDVPAAGGAASRTAR